MVSKPNIGDTGWGTTLNAALDALDAAVTTNAAAVATNTAAVATNTAAVAQRWIVVSHGSTASTARPTSSLPVMWQGTVAPTNGITRDRWYDETTEVEKRYDGTTWQIAGKSTYEASGDVIFDVTKAPFNAKFDAATNDTAAIQAALDAAEAAVATVDVTSGTARCATVVLPLGYAKVTGLKIASNVRIRGQGDKTILQLSGASGGSNANLIQSKNYGDPVGVDRGIWITDVRLIGNKANQAANLCPQTYCTADTALSTVGATVPVDDTTGFDASGRAWIGYMQVAYTGKTATSLTGVTLFSGTDTARKASWVTPAASKGHLIAIQGTRCHIRVYGSDGAGSGIYFQGPDPLASGGGYGPENVVHIGTRIDGCNRYGLEIGWGVPDGMIFGAVFGPNNLQGGMAVRSVDWQYAQLHLVGTYGSPINPIPQALLIAAGDFRGTSIYFDTWPGTTIVFDAAVNGWNGITDCDIAQTRHFQCSWGVGGGGHGVLFRGVKNHANTARLRFSGNNLGGPVAAGFTNAPWTRTVGAQNLAALAGNKLQVLTAMDFAPNSAIGGPLNLSTDVLSYTGRQISFAKLSAPAAIGDTTLTVDSTAGFDASGTITVLAEAGGSYTPMQVTYTGKTATTFTGIPPSSTGSITAAVLSTGERGAVSQQFFTGVSGGTLSVGNAISMYVDAMVAGVSEMQVSDPLFRSFRVQRFIMQPNDEYAVIGGISGGKRMRNTGTLSVAAGALTATVVHGMAEAPRVTGFVPTSDTQGRRWSVTVSATNITVTLDANAVTSPITFSWSAEVIP